MKLFSRLAAWSAILALSIPAPAFAVDTVPVFKSPSGTQQAAAGVAIVNSDNTVCNFKSGGNCSAGGGGGGGSLSAQANAANQTSTEGATTDPISMDLNRFLRVTAKQNGAWTAAATAAAASYATGFSSDVGNFSTSTACSTDAGACPLLDLLKRTNGRLTTVNTTLGTPFQAGGSIGNTAFGITASGSVDLGNISEGAWSGSGTASLISVEKSVRNLLSLPQVTINSVFGVNQFLRDGQDGAAVSFEDFRPSASTITAADVASTSTAGQSAVNQITGTPTAGSAVTFSLNGIAAANLTIKGTFVATSVIEASFDGGTTYVAISGLLRGSAITTNTITDKAVISLETAGADHLRVRATAYTSGTETVAMEGTSNTGGVKVLNPVRVVDSGGTSVDDTTNHALKVSGGVNGSGATPLIQADKSGAISVGTATTTEVIAGVSAKKIYLTSYTFLSVGAGTVKFVAGTGTNCGTGQVDLTGAMDVAANGGASPGSGVGPILITPTAAQAICVTTTGAATAKGHDAYAQF